jgi:hypothetical protein
MIPNKSTPIKNEILINIFAKGLLNKDETRIIFYIIRWSWGFDGVKRRQDWTKELTKRQIAEDIRMKESQFNRTINKMIIENKIIIKDRCYQFNEHYEKWMNLTKSKVFNSKELNKKLSETSQIVKVDLTKSKDELNKKLISTDPKANIDKGLPDCKETLKETKTKETLKKLSRTFEKCSEVYQLTLYLENKIRENNEVEARKEKKTEFQIQSWCKDMDLLINKDNTNPDEIKRIIDWVVKDDFWSDNVLSVKKLRKHYSRLYKKAINNTKSIKQLAAEDKFDWGDDKEVIDGEK